MVCTEGGVWRDVEGLGQGPDQVSCQEIRCELPPRNNNTVVSISSTERLKGTSVIRSKQSLDATYKVGSQLKYR